MKPESEANFRRDLVSVLRPSCFVQTIESGLTGCGIPDIYVCTASCAAWLELKVMVLRESQAAYPVQVPFRPGQLSWLKQHAAHGGVSALCIKLWINSSNEAKHGACNYHFVFGEAIRSVYRDIYDLCAKASLSTTKLVACDIARCICDARALASVR